MTKTLLRRALTRKPVSGHFTNQYLCLEDRTRWDSEQAPGITNAKCPTCDRETKPFASTDNATDARAILNQAVYNIANVIEGDNSQEWNSLKSLDKRV